MLKFIFLFFISILSYSQTHSLTGVVSDTLNIPLESANVIAKPLQNNAQLKFAVADNKGRYKLELEQTVKYEVTVSYIGFIEEIIVIEPNSTVATHNFKLKTTGEKLKEIIIKRSFLKVIIK